MMRQPSAKLTSLLAVAVFFATFATSQVVGQTFETIYSFTGGSDEGFPAGALISDGHGNLFGETEGTQNSFGSVFELSPASGGGWTLKTLYAFQGGSDGLFPVGGLAFDKHGNLFGTTAFGGTGTVASCTKQCGTVFELSPDGSGGWQKKEVYQFQGGLDGASPISGVVIDAAGNLFGTTSFGGANCSPFGQQGCGTVFELSPTSSGWSETILHDFSHGNCSTCLTTPQGGLLFDAQGNLYGTVSFGGPKSGGAVFKMIQSNGSWTYRVIHNFSGGNDGLSPYGTLTFDSQGRLYGTTLAGGLFNDGTVFLLTLQPSGYWLNRVIHNFNGTNGWGPFSGVVLDAAGNVYGTTGNGGGGTNCIDGCGIAYKLTAVSSTSWKMSVLHRFSGLDDGKFPNALFRDGVGNLFGTTNEGGADGLGSIFEIKH